jgi:hypothetical protein
VFNPVDRLGSGAANTFGGGHQAAWLHSPGSSLAEVSSSGFAPVRDVFYASARPPGAAPQTNQ